MHIFEINDVFGEKGRAEACELLMEMWSDCTVEWCSPDGIVVSKIVRSVSIGNSPLPPVPAPESVVCAVERSLATIYKKQTFF